MGNFPPQWSEWNGKYRDCIRDFWRGREQTLGEFAYRFTGSSDLYENTSRRPFASINFVTAHDGFTLHDLVSYNEKHNEANLEENHDGESHNRSWNCGVEGPTLDREIMGLRLRQKRNFLATLLLSQGVPMLLGGDEFGGPSRATTTPTARTTRSPGSTGRRPIPASWTSPGASSRSGGTTRSSGAGNGSRAGRSTASRGTTSAGSPRRASRW